MEPALPPGALPGPAVDRHPLAVLGNRSRLESGGALTPFHGCAMKRFLSSAIGSVLVALSAACHRPPARLTFGSVEASSAPPFVWDCEDDPYLTALRTRSDLDRFRRATDLETVRALTPWVAGLWEHSGSGRPSAADPLTILLEAKQGKRFRCVEYAIVLAGSLNALGIPARTVGLMRKDVETRFSGAGHVVVEAYLRDARTWVMVDPQWVAIPQDGTRPLHAVALQAALADGIPTLALEGLPRDRWEAYSRWIAPYLYYYAVPLDARTAAPEGSDEQVLLVPAGAETPTRFERSQAFAATPVRSPTSLYAAPPAVPSRCP